MTSLYKSIHTSADCNFIYIAKLAFVGYLVVSLWKIAYNYTSGEHITEVKDGKPLIYRNPQGKIRLADFMRTMIYSSVATLAVGMKGLKGKTDEKISEVVGHGGFFKTPEITQKIMSSCALDAAVSVCENAGEGALTAYRFSRCMLFAMWTAVLFPNFWIKFSRTEKIDDNGGWIESGWIEKGKFRTVFSWIRKRIKIVYRLTKIVIVGKKINKKHN